MEFTRLGEHKVRCLIAETEITDMGYSIEDILKNGTETHKFMEQIFSIAERQLDMKFTEGIKTVRADFLANHTLSLTFSTYSAEGMMGHLKDLLSDAISAATEMTPEELQKLMEESEKMQEMDERSDEDESEEPDVEAESSEQEAEKKKVKSFTGQQLIAAFVFEDFNLLMKVVEGMKRINPGKMPPSALYKYQSVYFLIMDFSGCEQSEVVKVALLTDEFADDFLAGATQCAFIEEHGQPILEKNALEQLACI